MLSKNPNKFYSSYIRQILGSESLVTDCDKILDNLSKIILTLDTGQIVTILCILFKRLTEYSDKMEVKAVIKIIDQLLLNIHSIDLFNFHVIKFFDSLDNFPSKELQLLSKQSNLILLVYGRDSKFSDQCRRVLTDDILPKIYEGSNDIFISENILFELCKSKFDRACLIPFLERSRSPLLMNYLDEEGIKYTGQICIHSINIKSALRSIMFEVDASQLSNIREIAALFDFFPEINERLAADFYLCFVLRKKDENVSSFDDIFVQIKNLLEERNRNIDFSKVISGLDVNYIDARELEQKHLRLLFLAIKPLFEDHYIDSIYNRAWNNKPLQYSVLKYISTNPLPFNLNFDKCSNRIKASDLDVPHELLHRCNSCWLSPDFVRRAFELASALNDISIFSELEDHSPELLLLGISHCGLSSDFVNNIIVSAFLKLVQKKEKKVATKLIRILFSTSEKFMKNVLLRVYESNRYNIRIIADFTGNNNDLFSTDSLSTNFTTDYAFASMSETKIIQFLKSEMRRFPEIATIIRNNSDEARSDDMIYTKDALSLFFRVISQIYNDLVMDNRVIVKNLYSFFEHQFDSSDFVFNVNVHRDDLRRAHDSARNTFSHFLHGTKSPLDVCNIINQSFTRDPLAYSATIHYITSELQYLNRHKDETLQRLAMLIASLINSRDKLLSQKRILLIFEFLKQILSDPETSYYNFAKNCIGELLPILDKYKSFASQLIRDTALRDNDKMLYNSLQKICKQGNDPLIMVGSKKLDVHPKLHRFSSIPTVPSQCVISVCDAISQGDIPLFEECLSTYTDHFDWIALYLIEALSEKISKFSLFEDLLVSKNPTNFRFCTVCTEAAYYLFYEYIKLPEFQTAAGAILRLKTANLGRIIGRITICESRPILSKYINLKEVLLHAFSQGKLYGVVPFVCEIFTLVREKNKLFDPPNPYTSSIIQVLAAIYLTDCLKTFIKQRILLLFDLFKINIGMINHPYQFITENTQNNYDYLVTPFLLKLSVSSSDFEGLLADDDRAYKIIVSKNIYLPDIPKEYAPRIKEKILKIIVDGNHFNDAKKNASIAASTALYFIMRDIAGAEGSTDIANNVTRQLSNALSLYMAPMKIPRLFHRITNDLKEEFPHLSNSWCEEFSAKNYEWFSQLLRDFTREKALIEVHRKLKSFDDDIKHGRVVEPGCLQIYSDFDDLNLSLQGFNPIDFQQQREKLIKIDERVEEYFNRDDKDKLEYTANPTSIDSIKSKIKTVFSKFNTQVDSNRATGVLCTIAKSVSSRVLKIVQPYVLNLVKTTIRSSDIILDLINLGFIEVKELDILYTDLLNSEPFSINNVNLVIQVLMKCSRTVPPRGFVSTLTYINTILPSQLATDNPCTEELNILKESYHQIDACERPSHNDLYPAPFEEPLKDTTVDLSILDEFDQAINVNDIESINEENLKSLATNILSRDITTYLVLFQSQEKELLTIRLLRCLKEVDDENDRSFTLRAIDAIDTLVSAYGKVVNSDMRHYFRIAFAIIPSACKSIDTAIYYAKKFLHSNNPTQKPMFTFSWIVLMSNRDLVSTLLCDSRGWVIYTVLYCSFAHALSKLDPNTHAKPFDIVYKAFLKLTLILIHDFPQFAKKVSQLIVGILPSHFVQLRNILLSFSSKDSFQIPMIELLSPELQANIKNLLASTDLNFRAIREVEGSDDETFIRALVETLLRSQLNERDYSIEHTKCFRVINALKTEKNDKISPLYAHSLADHLRNDDELCDIAAKTLAAVIISREDANNPSLWKVQGEIFFRVIIERFSAPPPHPKPLISFVQDYIHQIMELETVQKSEFIKSFLERCTNLSRN